MKIRHGFVSNSSSSSFVVMMTKEHFDKAMDAIHPYSKACIEALGFSKGKFNEDEVITIGSLSVQGYSAWDEIEIEYNEDKHGKVDEPDDLKYDAIYTLTAKVKDFFGNDAVVESHLDG